MDEKRKDIELSMLLREPEEDRGLGIPYERWSLGRLLEKLYFTHNFSTVLEGPADGMAGIKGLNSLPLVKLNCSLTVNLPSKRQMKIAREVFTLHKLEAAFACSEDFQLSFPSGSFDLVWNFCTAHILDPFSLMEDMIRISRKYVMVIVPNPLNYGFLLHRLNHRMTGEAWIHGDVKYMNIKSLSSWLEKRNMKILETFLVDIPFWPDIDKPPEILLGDFLPFLKGWLTKRAEKRYDKDSYRFDRLHYFSKDPGFEKFMHRLSIIERTFPFFIQILFAHHNGVLACKR